MVWFGEVAEWSNVPDSKSGVLSKVPRVRIPPSPPYTTAEPLSTELYVFEDLLPTTKTLSGYGSGWIWGIGKITSNLILKLF